MTGALLDLQYVVAADGHPGQAGAAQVVETEALARRVVAEERSALDLGCFEMLRLRHAYASLFRAHSVNVHPTLMGLTAFSSSEPSAQPTSPVRMLKLRLDAEALAVFGDGLIIASAALNWPPRTDVVAAVFQGLANE